MTLTISGQNNVVYRNGTSQTHRITIVASGEANIEVKPKAGLKTLHQESIARHGGAASLEVPADHRIEIDVIGSQTQIEISFLGVT